MNLDAFCIIENGIIQDALEKIEKNNKGFLIVLNSNDAVIGTLTDGDLRRSFIQGKTIDSMISDSFSRKFEKISIEDDFSKVIQVFKSQKIRFLPIINKNNELLNIITKNNLHVLLMEDIEFTWDYDFISLNDSILEHEIYDRPWGIYKTTFLNNYSQSKILKINPGKELSLQEHKMREEYWVVIYGVGEVIVGESKKNIEAGSFIFIPKSCKHKLKNISKKLPLMIAEVQLGEYFGEDDIIRYDTLY